MILKQLIFWLTGLLLLTSCSIEKRYHSSGFHVEWNKPVTIKNLAAKPKETIQIEPISTRESELKRQENKLPSIDLKQVNTLTFKKPAVQGSKASVGSNKTSKTKAVAKTLIAPKPRKNDEPEPKQLEIFGLVSFLLLVLPFLTMIGLGENDGIVIFVPLLFLISSALAGFSLGRISAKPYLYYGALFGFLTLGAMLGLMVLLILYLLFPPFH